MDAPNFTRTDIPDSVATSDANVSRGASTVPRGHQSLPFPDRQQTSTASLQLMRERELEGYYDRQPPLLIHRGALPLWQAPPARPPFPPPQQRPLPLSSVSRLPLLPPSYGPPRSNGTAAGAALLNLTSYGRDPHPYQNEGIGNVHPDPRHSPHDDEEEVYNYYYDDGPYWDPPRPAYLGILPQYPVDYHSHYHYHPHQPPHDHHQLPDPYPPPPHPPPPLPAPPGSYPAQHDPRYMRPPPSSYRAMPPLHPTASYDPHSYDPQQQYEEQRYDPQQQYEAQHPYEEPHYEQQQYGSRYYERDWEPAAASLISHSRSDAPPNGGAAGYDDHRGVDDDWPPRRGAASESAAVASAPQPVATSAGTTMDTSMSSGTKSSATAAAAAAAGATTNGSNGSRMSGRRAVAAATSLAASAATSRDNGHNGAAGEVDELGDDDNGVGDAAAADQDDDDMDGDLEDEDDLDDDRSHRRGRGGLGGRAAASDRDRRSMSGRSAARRAARQYFVFNARTYEVMVETQRALRDAANPPTNADVARSVALAEQVARNAAERKRWKRLVGNVSLEPRKPQGRNLRWHSSMLMLVPEEDWHQILSDIHGSDRPVEEHLSPNQTITEVKSKYETRKSRCGINAQYIDEFLARCACARSR